MHDNNENRIGDTIRIRRPPKVVTDDLGNSVWMLDIEPYSFELESQPCTDPYNNCSPATAASNPPR